ncbi:6821_t:CDS:2, partial [Scutellospora calospora]
IMDHHLKDETAASQFRKLWGKKAEQDSPISTLSSLWNKGLQYFAGKLNEIVILSSNIPNYIYNKSEYTNGFRNLSGIRATSSALRYSSIFIPQPLVPTSTKKSFYVDLIEIVIQFELSARWPNNLRHISDMDIFTDSKFAFRCRIYNEREMTLLDRGIKDKKFSQLKKDIYTKALEREKRMFIEIPMHTLQIQTLCNKWPKEWIECLSSQVYLEPCPWNRLGNGFVGFLRVLKLITFWNNELMIVDLSEENKSSFKNNTSEN